MTVKRFDLARLSSKVSKTPQGFLRAPAFFTRVGVFEYDRADGTKVRELRPEEEVFHENSLATARSLPLTRGHRGMVTPANIKEFGIGFGGETVTKEDDKLAGTVIVTEETAIKDVERGDLSELSMGYNCSIEVTPGNHPVFGRYDQIQRNIRYNHAAFGKPDWGRAGSDIGVRLDSADAVLRTDSAQLERFILQQMDLHGMSRFAMSEKMSMSLFMFEDILYGWITPTGAQLTTIASALGVEVESLEILVPRIDRADSRSVSVETEVITIAGVQFTVPKNAAQAFRADSTRKGESITELTSSQEKLQGRFDAQAEELKTSKAKVIELDDPKRFDSAVADRLVLMEKARKVLGADADIKGSDREIMEQTLRHDDKEMTLEGKTDDYVTARFDAKLEGLTETRVVAKSETRKAAVDATRTDADDKSADAAAKRMREDGKEAWKSSNRAELMG